MSDKFSLNVYLDVRNALPSRRPIVSRLFDLKSSRAEDGPFLSSRVQSAELADQGTRSWFFKSPHSITIRQSSASFVRNCENNATMGLVQN